MRIKTYIVESLSEYYETITKVAINAKIVQGEPLWFRGNSNEKYLLIPNILRQKDESTGFDGYYNLRNLREDYRLQNYKARTFHMLDTRPEGKMDWQALYQHNRGKSRLLDWSESARIALDFALEVFLDPRNRQSIKGRGEVVQPCVWVVNPKELNRIVYRKFQNNEILIKKACNMFTNSSNVAREIRNYMQKQYYFNLEMPDYSDLSIDGLPNLGVIAEQRDKVLSCLENMLITGEFNPFFFMCLRYFVDALPVYIDDNMITDVPIVPMAVMHQYQGERIRSQRGVFTVFPNYEMGKLAKKYNALQCDVRALDNMMVCEGILYKLRIIDPERIATELLYSGERHTELYPESEYYVHTMEAESFC